MSEAVEDAVGTAPERTTVKLLAQKRRALLAARERYATAKAMRDEQGMSDAGRLIDALRVLLPELEQEVAERLEAAGARRAKAWLAEQVSARATLTQKVQAAQKKVRSALDAAVAAIAAEVSLREEAAQVDLASEVLCARFALPRSATRVSLPDIQDYGTPLLRAVDGLRPAHWGSRRLVVPLIASMTEEQRRAANVNAALAFAKSYAKELPRDVVAIMADAPDPAASVAKPKAEEAVDAVHAQAAVEATALGKLGVSAGHVHRG